MLLSRVCYICQ